MLKHLLFCLAVISIAATALAQSNATDWNTVKALATGADVRLTTGFRTVHGQVLRVSDGNIVLALGKGQEMFSQQEVLRVRLRGDSHRGRNSLIGLGGGAAIGAIIGAAAHQDCTGFCIFYTSRGTDTAAGAVVGGGLGAIIGALIPTRSWLEIYRK
jgi:hypothetical protein